MANWCKTEYTFTGDRESFEGIYALMHGLENEEVADDESDFGSAWLGRLVTALGRDRETIKCRGEWTDLCLNDDTLTFTTWTAWTPAYEVIELLRLKFPGTEYYFYAEESGNDLYETNDKEGRYYPTRYVAYYNDGKEMHESRADNETDIIDWAHIIAEAYLYTVDDINNYFEKLQEESDGDKYGHISEVNVIETSEALTLYFDDSGTGRLVRPDGLTVGTLEI